MTAFFVAAALLFVPAQAGVVTGVTDSAITTSIKTEIGVNPNVNTFGVHVSTNDGVVTLSGRVEDETQKALAEQIARDTKGVTDVVNNLTIIPTTITEKQERAFKQRATDKSVATAVRSRMVFNKESKGLKVGVDVVNGVVTLHGVVNTEEQKERLGKIASGTKGVESVVNNLVVRQRERHGFVGGVGTGMGDEWMEKKIESAILFTRKLSIRELDVEVDDGICYLSGVVENEEMKKVAGDIAAGYAGIREVKNSVIVREGGVTVEVPKKEGPVRPAPKASPNRKLGDDPPKGHVTEMNRDAPEEEVAPKEDEEKDAPAAEEAPESDGGLQESDPVDEPAPTIEEKPLEAPK